MGHDHGAECRPRSGSYLEEFDFTTALHRGAGLGHATMPPLEIRSTAGDCTRCTAVAQKRGMVVFRLRRPPASAFPPTPLRRKIEQQVAKPAHEHLIIFTDAAQTDPDLAVGEARAGQARRLPRAHLPPIASRATRCIQKLEAIAFSLGRGRQLSR